MSPDDATPEVPEDVPAADEAPELVTGSAPQEGEAEASAGDTVISGEEPQELPTGSAPQEGEGEAPDAEAPPKRRTARTRKAKVVAEEPAAADAPEAGEADEADAEEPVAAEASEVDEAGQADAEEPVAATAEAPEADAEAQTTAKPRRRARAAKEPEAAPKPAPTRSRPAARRAVVRAQAKYVRTSARKARMVCGHIRGKSVDEARAILAFTPRDVARDWSKLLESAVANAENNHELVGDDLVVHEAYADEGPTIKRFRPRAMGRATPIRKRTSHLTITLTPRS
jgi:ribosomal protein L22